MKIFFAILFLVAAVGGAFAYVRNPDAVAWAEGKVKDDVKVFTTMATVLWNSSSTTTTTTDTTTTVDATPDIPPSDTPAPQPAPKPWTRPAITPAQPNWTWTTAQGTYHKVQIVKVEADCVTILDDQGGALVPISTLPPDLQRQLNYDPAAAAAAAAQRQRDDAVSGAALARERAADPHNARTATDYQSALAEAKRTGQRVMLHFTGSDWCPYCQSLDSEVLSTGTFQSFLATNYIFMTVDFPRSNPLPADIQAQNKALAGKYGVNGYPTLVVIDGNERVLGRVTGYGPGTGPGPIIDELKSFH